MTRTADFSTNYVNEYNLVEALSKSFTEVYNFTSVRSLEMALDERFWLFKSEVREQLLKRNKPHKRAYLDELVSEFEKVENDFTENLASALNNPSELQKLQLSFLKLSIAYLTEQRERYITKNVLPDTPVNALDADWSITSFGFLDQKFDAQILRDFYTAAQEELHCFDTVLTSCDVFVYVLTHPNLVELSRDFAIHFVCDSVCAAHCLRALKLWFSHLSYINIERSRRFYTASEAPFNANYISKLLAKDFKKRTNLENIVIGLT